jgi:hypothetical protein
MAYRDDLEAALAHVESLEEELAEARRASDTDHARIAELERKLASAQTQAQAKRATGSQARSADVPSAAPSAPQPELKGSPAARVVAAIAGCGLFTVVIVALANRPAGPRVVDIDAEAAKALALARKELPDPVLIGIDGRYVDPQGKSDLVKYHGKVIYEFYSPSRASVPPPAPNGPIGAPPPQVTWPACAVEVRYRDSGVDTITRADHGGACGTPLPSAPRCRVTDVWQEAIRRGAPREALASIRLRAHTRGGRERSMWQMTISDGTHTVFEMEVFDECPFAGSP